MIVSILLVLCLQQIQPAVPYKFLTPLDPKFKADYSVMGSSMGVPSTLASLVSNSDIIVVGKFEGIIQHRHNPHNSKGYEQSTIYSFNVELYLKGLGKNKIKIYQVGGPLDWIDSKRNKLGQGYKLRGDPFPLIGAKYILLLNDPSAHNLIMAEKGFRETERNGVKGISHYADEFNYSFPTRSKIIIQDGITFPGQIVEDSSASWVLVPGTFGGNLQLTGISEQKAIDNIRLAVKETSIDSINRRYKFVPPTVSGKK